MLRYIKDDEKTKKIYVSGYMCSPETAASEFAFTRMVNLSNAGKDPGDDGKMQAFHIIQSFPDDLDISDDEVHQCGIDLVKKLEKYQAVIASHVEPVVGDDGKVHGQAKHNHILLCSHMLPEYIDPENSKKMKYHDCRESYAQLRRLNDEVAIEHGLPVIDEKTYGKGISWYELREKNEGRSWKQDVKDDINEAMKLTSSWDEYVKHMETLGYTIREGKYETYVTSENRRVRGITLGYEYTRNYMEGYWRYRSGDVKFSPERAASVTVDRLIAYQGDKDQRYYIKIPRLRKRNGMPYDLFYPVTDAKDEKNVRTYIKDDAVYPLYKGRDELIGTVRGDIAAAVLTGNHELAYGLQREYEAEENDIAVKGEIERVLEKEKRKGFFIEGWNNSKTGKPYSIDIYDEEGNRRPLLELLFILAYMVIHNEYPDFILPEVVRRKDPRPIIIVSDEKEGALDEMKTALAMVKREQISTEDDLDERIKETGKKIAALKRKIRVNDDVKQKMISTAENVSCLEDGDEIEKFDARFRECLRLERDFSVRIKKLNREYNELKKLSYAVSKAKSRDFCYGKQKVESFERKRELER